MKCDRQICSTRELHPPANLSFLCHKALPTLALALWQREAGLNASVWPAQVCMLCIR